MHFSTYSSISLVAYLISGALFTIIFFKGKASKPISWAALFTGIVAIVTHSIELHQTLPIAGSLDLNIFHTLEILLWLMSLLVALLSIRYPIESLAWVTFSLAGISVFLADNVAHDKYLVALSGTWQSNAHVLASLLAFSLIGIAAIQAMLAAYQSRKLKQKQLKRLLRILPPLDIMESMLFQLVRGGVVLLTISLFTGYFVVDDMVEQKVVHKVFFTVIAWLIFSGLLIGRARKGWRGKSAFKAVYIGFILLILGFIGSKFAIALISNT